MLFHSTQCLYLYFSDEQRKFPKDHLTCSTSVKYTHYKRNYAHCLLLSYCFHFTISFCEFTTIHKPVQLIAKQLNSNIFLCWERSIWEKDDAICVPLAHDLDFLTQLFSRKRGNEIEGQKSLTDMGFPVSLVVLQNSLVSRVIAAAECWKSARGREDAEGSGHLLSFQSLVSGKHIS